MLNRDHLRDFTVFVLLAVIGIVGRWAQPDWHFTPLMAVALVGGYYFRSFWVAAALPLAIRAISDMGLDSHDSAAVQLSVYLMMVVPLALGRWARGAEGWSLVGKGILCGLAPATAFFVVTNFVHWASTSMYSHTWEGLANCYVAALPFYRMMLTGDLFYLIVLVGCVALAGAKTPALAPLRVKR